ncbi:unnamed protein product [marine sediment metagenome]|uniref:Uncharacterized protein n=1 Tax=marine sediment metagenome TaxID=412755 RepID=X1RPC2_9ZZZZ
MQINIKAHNATDLGFSTNITLTAELIAEILILSKPDSDGDSCFFDSYENHRVMAWVGKANEKTFQSNLYFGYETKRGGKLSKKTPRIIQLIDILSRTNQQLTFECRASFQFAKKLRAKPIVHLPQKYIEMPGYAFR